MMKITYKFKNLKITEDIKKKIDQHFQNLITKYWFFTSEDWMHIQIKKNKLSFFEMKIEIHLFKTGTSIFAKGSEKEIEEVIINCKHKINQQLIKIKEKKR